MIACLGPRDPFHRDRVVMLSDDGAGAPATRVGPMAAHAAGPAAAKVVVFTPYQGAVTVGVLGLGEAPVLARGFVGRGEVNDGRGAVIPVNRGVGARVHAGVSEAHCGRRGR
jgi:hypothetical protein